MVGERIHIQEFFSEKKAELTSGLYRSQFCAVASSPDISEVKQL